MAPEEQPSSDVRLYCPKCEMEVRDPLTCGDCSAVICRRCGTPLESADELAMDEQERLAARAPFRHGGAGGFDRLAGWFGEWAAGGLQGRRFTTTPGRCSC